MSEQLDLFEKENTEKTTFQDMLHILKIRKYTPDKFGKKIFEWIKNSNSKSVPTLSLFSGAGGLDIGFENSGFNIVEQVEVESDFAETLKENSNATVRCQDIREYNAEHLKGKVDFVIGGPPCQPFSSAARRAYGVNGTIDIRGTLFYEYVRILKECKPKGFLFENVYGIVSSNKGQDWKMITDAFKEIGYFLHFRVLNAADYGVPQHRERLIIVGSYHNQCDYAFPAPTHGADSIDRTPYYSAKAALENGDVDDDLSKLEVTGKYADLLKDIPAGMNYSYYTSKVNNPRALFGWRSKFSDFLYKADPNQPVRTIKASGGQYTGPFHWNNRRFSVSELKRLQTFPDAYYLYGSKRIMEKQIGNSVPPQFARALAISIRQQIFSLPVPVNYNLLEVTDKLTFRREKRILSQKYYKQVRDHFATSAIDIDDNLKKDSWYFYYGENLRLKQCKMMDANFYVEFDVEDDSIRVTNYEVKNGKVVKKNIKSDINVTLSEKLGTQQIKNFELKNFASTGIGFSVGWKVLERVLESKKLKADLVQLNGYYQYQSKFSIEYKISNDFFINPIIIKSILSNNLVNRLVSTQDVANIWNVDEKEVKSSFIVLKNIGYEIRNINTNPQIPKDHWLIPYAFPTLSSNSVQMHKFL